MLVIDYILLGIVGLFVWIGFWAGFIKSLGRVLGLFIGIAIAAHYYDLLAGAWQWVFFDNEAITKVVLFVLIFFVVSRVVGIVFWLVDKLFNVARLLPFLTTLNRLLGAALGLIEGVLIVGVVLLLLSKFAPSDTLKENINDSIVAQSLIDSTLIVKPLLPDEVTSSPVIELFSKPSGVESN